MASIFGTIRKENEDEIVVEAYEGFVDPSQAGLQTILAESTAEAMQLQAGLYITDVLMEEAVFEGAAEPEVLLEGVVGDTWTKLKKQFEAMWAKVTAWFRKAREGLVLKFTTGEKFIKKYKDDILKKQAKGFSYTGYKYTLEEGKKTVDGIIAKLEDELEKAVGFTVSDESQKTIAGQKAAISSHGKSESYDIAAAKRELLASAGSEEMKDLQTNAYKSFRGGESDKSEFEDFNGNSKEAMVAWLEQAPGRIRDLDKAKSAIDADFKRVLNAIKLASKSIKREKTEGEEAKTAKGQNVGFAAHKFALAQYALTAISSINGVRVSAYKDSAKQFEKVLRSYLSYKPAKEGAEDLVDEDIQSQEPTSILESAMRFV